MISGASQSNIFVGQVRFAQNVSFLDAADVQSAFQEQLSVLAGFAVSNSAINPTNPIQVGAYTINDSYNGGYFPFGVPYPFPTFNLVRSNGVWTAPDLSGMSLVLPQQTVTVIPGMTSCNIKVYSNGVPIFDVDSSCTNASFDVSIDLIHQSVTIDTVYLASGNGVLGPYSLVMSFITASNGLQEVNGNGELVPEPPLRIENFSVQNGIASLKVVGGDAGMVFSVQKSTDLEAWFQVAGPYTVGTNPWSIMFQDTASNRLDFYRTATTNAIPR
jgi:hypothetical protein